MAVQMCAKITTFWKQITLCQRIKNRFKVKTEEEHTVSMNKIRTQLKPLVTSLKIICGYPIIAVELNTVEKSKKAENEGWVCEGEVFETEETKHEIRYEMVALSWKSPWMWYSYIIKCCNIFSILAIMFNLAWNIAFPVKLIEFGPSFLALAGPTAVSFSAESYLAIASIMKILRIFAVFLNTKSFVVWLNNWNEFEKAFSISFRKEHNVYFKTKIGRFLRAVLMYCFYIPQIVIILFVLPFMTRSFILHIEYVSYVVLIWGTIALWQEEILEECKVHITIQTIVSAYEQIREGIEKQKLVGDIDPLDVVRWRSLIVLARKQTALLFSCLKSQQLISVADTIITCSMGLSSMLLVFAEGDSDKIATSPFLTINSHCCGSLLKIYIKILRAERIPAQELLIARQILELEEKSCDPSTKSELKFLHTMLTQDTISTNLGNYCLMDKNLLLQVGVQVVTYLIVIIQFHGSSSLSPKVH